jgi:hypothetical protein
VPLVMCRCGHALEEHRGIVCHGIGKRGGRCRCDSGGKP